MRPTGEWLNQPGGLAERLMRLRKAAGLTGNQLAEQLGWHRTKVPKLENGRQLPSEEDITAWARATGQPEAAAELHDMLAEAQVRHRQYRHRLRRGLAGVQEEIDRLTREARRIRNVETMFVPGLLQTPGYARYRLLEAVRNKGFAESGVEPAVTARMRRQEILWEGDREFEFIVSEVALLARICPAHEMLSQLGRLDATTRLANVTLAIIPLDADLMTTTDVGFLLLDDVAYLETPTSEDLLQGTEAAAYARIADGLRAEAVTGDAALELIASASERARRFLGGQG